MLLPEGNAHYVNRMTSNTLMLVTDTEACSASPTP